MIDSERLLLRLLTTLSDANYKAVVLQSYIAEYGPLSEEAAAKVRELLKKGH